MSSMKRISEYLKSNLPIFMVIAEVGLSALIIAKIAYTEIDWVAYMQQVETFLNGERDYIKIEGQTGPLVYPAGHVYIFTVLYYLTEHGKNIFTAQVIFMLIYVSQIYVLTQIYKHAL